MNPAARPTAAGFLALAVGGGAVLVALVAVLKSGPPEGDPLAEARAAIQRGDYAAALKAYRGRLPESGDALEDHRAYQNAARRLAKTDPRLLESVRGEYAAILVRHKAEAWAIYLAARLDEGEAFERGMRAALQADPGYVPALSGYANWSYDRGAHESAAEFYERAWALGSRENVDRHLVALFRTKRHDAIDRLIEHLRATPPGDGVSLIAFPLDSGSPAVALLVGYGPGAPYVWALQFVRGDNSTRLYSVVKNPADWSLHGSEGWTPHKPEGLPSNGPELKRSPDSPSFSTVLQEARRRLDDGEKKGG